MSYLLTLKAVAGAKLYNFFHDEKAVVGVREYGKAISDSFFSAWIL